MPTPLLFQSYLLGSLAK